MYKYKELLDINIESIMCIVISFDGNINVFAPDDIDFSQQEIITISNIINTKQQYFLSYELPDAIRNTVESKITTSNYICHTHYNKKNYTLKIFSFSRHISINSNFSFSLLTKYISYLSNKLETFGDKRKKKYYIENLFKNNGFYNIEKEKVQNFLNDISISRYPIKNKSELHTVILSPQQSKVMLGLTNGLTYNQIESKYGIKVKTIEHYLMLIKAKTGYRNKVELICAFIDANPWLKEFKDE